jgi:hypothetical protein
VSKLALSLTGSALPLEGNLSLFFFNFSIPIEFAEAFPPSAPLWNRAAPARDGAREQGARRGCFAPRLRARGPRRADDSALHVDAALFAGRRLEQQQLLRVLLDRQVAPQRVIVALELRAAAQELVNSQA